MPLCHENAKYQNEKYLDVDVAVGGWVDRGQGLEKGGAVGLALLVHVGRLGQLDVADTDDPGRGGLLLLDGRQLDVVDTDALLKDLKKK